MNQIKKIFQLIIITTLIPVSLLAGSELAREQTFVSFDTETTGFSQDKDRIVEVGAIRFNADGIQQRTNWLMNPEREIPFYAERVHGISDNDVKDSPAFAEVYRDIEKFFGDSILFAHNASYDIRMMHAEIERNDFEQPKNKVIDSLNLFRAWFPDAPSHSLEPLSEYLGISGDEYHRAESDAAYVIRIFIHGIKQKPADYSIDQMLTEAKGAKEF